MNSNPLRLRIALLLLLTALFPAVARAQYGYTTTSNQVTITSYSGGGGSVVIPDTINGMPVVAIGPSAFNQVSTLTAVTMGTNLTTIGEAAFFQCQELTQVSFTKSVTNMSPAPFYDCQSLTTITMSGTNAYVLVTNDVIFNANMTTIFQYPNGLSGSYTIPASVTNLNLAFVGNLLVAINVNVSNPVYGSANGVLFNKAGTILVNYPGSASGAYTVPATVTNILGASFEYSKGVTAITIGTNVTGIGYAAFFFAAGLGSINVATNSAYFASSNGVLFNKSMTQLIQYPIAVSGGYVIPGTVTNIIDGAFGNAFYLTSVVIPNSVTYIGLEAFYACASLTNVVIGNGVTNIGQEAFFYCPSLPSIVIPPSVATISEYAFGDCESLTSICFEGKEPVDGGTIFYFDEALTSVLYVSGEPGWGATYDGYATTPCTTCGNTTTPPQLTITHSGTNVVLTWPSSFSGFTLQSITNLLSNNWSTVTPAPVVVNNLNTVTNGVTGTRKFYRLSE